MFIDTFFAVIFYGTLIAVLVYGYFVYRNHKRPDDYVAPPKKKKKRKGRHPFDG